MRDLCDTRSAAQCLVFADGEVWKNDASRRYRVARYDNRSDIRTSRATRENDQVSLVFNFNSSPSAVQMCNSTIVTCHSSVRSSSPFTHTSLFLFLSSR